MPFVKLDCGILNSTLWYERTAREAFLTALLMAEPFETDTPLDQIEVDTLNFTGWQVPPGRYGFVAAAGVGILRRAGITNQDEGIEALRLLGLPEASSRSQEFDGRRLVRVDGGYIVLNFFKYRDRDYTTAARSKRYRERLKAESSRRDISTSRRDITQAEAEAEAEVERTNTKSAEPCSASSAAFLVFPLADGKPWELTAYQMRFWEKTYEALDVAAEMRKAQAWIEANPSKRKTYRGMAKFLVAWLNRADEGARAPVSMPANRAPARAEWVCRHAPHCAGQWECIRKDQIAAVKAGA